MASDFIAGCVGGAAGVLAGHPLDTVKVRLQTQSHVTPTYHGTFDCLRKITMNEGINGLYRGIASPLVGVTALNALTFGIQGNIRRLMKNPDSVMSQFSAGMVTGAIQSIVVSPMELVKSRMQLQTAPSNTPSRTSSSTNGQSSTWQCFRDIVQREGIKNGLMRGFSVTLLREIPGFGIYFGTYELLTTGLYGSSKFSLLNMLMAGGTAGVASWVIAYPMDVIKTRLQTDGLNGKRMYKNARHCLKQCLAVEGWRGLCRGLNSVCLRAFPTNAVTLATVSTVLRTLDQHSNDMNFIEEYLPADLLLQQLQMQAASTSATCIKPVSITTVTVKWYSESELTRDRVAKLFRALGSIDSMMSSSYGVQQIVHNNSQGAQVCPLEAAIEPVTEDEVSQWAQRYPSQFRKDSQGARKVTRRKTKVVARIIEYESIVELDDDQEVEEYFGDVCENSEKFTV